MTAKEFSGADWISRAVEPSTRISRQIETTHIDWAEAGDTLAQSFEFSGSVVAVSVWLSEPKDVDHPYDSPVDFSVVLRNENGEEIARKRWSGPQLVWDYFGTLLELDRPAPPGKYLVELVSELGTIGWHSHSGPAPVLDDGVSPLAINGQAFRNAEPIAGVRTLGVETLPAPNPMFSKKFDLEAAPIEASISAVVLGTGVIFVNGVRVGVEEIEPAVTDYDQTILYRTWDIRHLLRTGENSIEILAGRERFAARGGDVWGWNLAPWHREPTAIVAVRVTDNSGDVKKVVSDSSWLTAPGPVQSERLFRGEDWVITANAPEWTSVSVVAPPRGKLKLSNAVPIKAYPPIAPVTATQAAPGKTVYDFGAVMVGRLTCKVTARSGATIRVVSGEQLAEDGSVLCENYLVAGEAQLDTLTCETDLVDFSWEIEFGYRGFRWIQVEVVGEATTQSVRAVPLYTPLEETGTFESNLPVLNWINDATARTFRNNLHGIPTDTPIYEKNGWTADAHLATEALLHHFDLSKAFSKWMDDHADAQREDGAIPHIIPTPGWGRESDPTWSSSVAFIPWYLYNEYGNLDELRQRVPMITRFADSIVSGLTDDLWTKRTWGDWLAPGYMVGPEGMQPIGTVMAAGTLKLIAGILDECGAPRSAEFAAQAARIGDRYHAEYFDSESGTYRVQGVGYRQALNVLPLAFGLVPLINRTSVTEGLVQDIENRTEGHLDCGAVSVRYLLQTLSDAGRDDLAITVLTQESRPSWGAWYAAGESTLLESWDIDARSRNHYFLGSVSSWIQQRVGGLKLVKAGWQEFEVSPIDDSRVSGASLSHSTPLGEVAVAWLRGPGGFDIQLTVPEGSTATVKVRDYSERLGAGEHRVFVPQSDR